MLKNVLSISYQSYRPQLYNGSVNDPASRYHVCLQDCSVSECVCVHFAGSWTTLYRLVYIYLSVCEYIGSCVWISVCVHKYVNVCGWNVSVCVSVVLWADSEGRLYWRRNLEHWLPEERLEKTSDQMENIHCAAPLHCPATGQGWALAVNNTHLTLSLSLSPSCSLSSCPLWRCVADPSLSSLEQKAL